MDREDTILNQLRTAEDLTAELMDRLAPDVLPPLDAKAEENVRPEVPYAEGSIPHLLDRLIGRLGFILNMVKAASVRLGTGPGQLREIKKAR